MAETRLSLEKRIQAIKIYYETRNATKTVQQLKLLFPNYWQVCYSSVKIANTVTGKRFEETNSVADRKKDLRSKRELAELKKECLKLWKGLQRTVNTSSYWPATDNN